MNTLGINKTRTKVSGNYRIIIFLKPLKKKYRGQIKMNQQKIRYTAAKSFSLTFHEGPVLRTLLFREKSLTKRNNLHCLMSKDKHLQINYKTFKIYDAHQAR